jgi:hypothetical protein
LEPRLLHACDTPTGNHSSRATERTYVVAAKSAARIWKKATSRSSDEHQLIARTVDLASRRTRAELAAAFCRKLFSQVLPMTDHRFELQILLANDDSGEQ